MVKDYGKAYTDKVKRDGELIEKYIDNSPKWPSDDHHEIYRGMYLGVDEDFQSLMNDLNASYFEFGASSSFSSKAKVAMQFAHAGEYVGERSYVFRVSGEMEAASVYSISSHQHEDEVLMSKRQKFIVEDQVKVMKPGGHKVSHIEVRLRALPIEIDYL